MTETLRAGIGVVRGRPLLITILGIALFVGLSSEGYDRLWEAHFLRSFSFPALGSLEPVVWFGLINVGAMLLGIAGTELVRRRVNTSDHAAVTRALFLIQGVRTVSIVAFGLAGSFAGALVTFWTSAVTRRMGGPLYSAWLTQNIEPRVRATVLSMTNLMDALGQIAGGPAVGALGRSVSVRAALIASGVLLAPVLALLLRASRQPGRASEPREALAQARE